MLVHVRVYVSMLEEVYYREAKIDWLIVDLNVLSRRVINTT